MAKTLILSSCIAVMNICKDTISIDLQTMDERKSVYLKTDVYYPVPIDLCNSSFKLTFKDSVSDELRFDNLLQKASNNTIEVKIGKHHLLI